MAYRLQATRRPKPPPPICKKVPPPPAEATEFPPPTMQVYVEATALEGTFPWHVKGACVAHAQSPIYHGTVGDPAESSVFIQIFFIPGFQQWGIVLEFFRQFILLDATIQAFTRKFEGPGFYEEWTEVDTPAGGSFKYSVAS